MHRFHNGARSKAGPQTTGRTIHWAGEYDFFTGLLGFGVNSRNSKMVVELAGIKAGDSVLDVACGTGNLTLTAQSYVRPSGKVYGIDASPEMIEAAKKKAARLGLPVEFRLEPAEELGFPDSTFDAVMSRLAFHHLPDDLKQRALAQIWRVLKPGGALLIADMTMPGHSMIGHVASIFASPRLMEATLSQYGKLMTEAGFVDIESGPTLSTLLAFVRGKKPGGGSE